MLNVKSDFSNSFNHFLTMQKYNFFLKYKFFFTFFFKFFFVVRNLIRFALWIAVCGCGSMVRGLFSSQSMIVCTIIKCTGHKVLPYTINMQSDVLMMYHLDSTLIHRYSKTLIHRYMLLL